MNIPCCILAVADSKPAALELVKHNFGKHIPHAFRDNAAFLEGGGECSIHGKWCSLPCNKPGLCTTGLPCQPFTRARDKTTKSSPRTGCAEERPDWTTVMEQWASYLDTRSPEMFAVEEVPEFATTEVDGKLCLKTFCKMASNRQYAVRVVKANHAIWAAYPKER